MRESRVSGELMDVAQEVMRFGERCMQAGRSWLSERRENMNRYEEGRVPRHEEEPWRREPHFGRTQYGYREQSERERMRSGDWSEEGDWEYEGGPERFGTAEGQPHYRQSGGPREFGIYSTGTGDYYRGRRGYGARASFGSEFGSYGRGSGYGEGSGYTRPGRQEEGPGRQWRFGARGRLGGGYRPTHGGPEYPDEGEMSGYRSPEASAQPYEYPGHYRFGQYGYGYGHGARAPRGYRGVGPRSYVRSDERIAEDLNERLTDDEDLDAGDINVRVSDGKVTLEGSVGNRWMKHRAEDIADSCAGVKEVENRVVVRTMQEAEAAEQRVGKGSGRAPTATAGTGGTTPH